MHGSSATESGQTTETIPTLGNISCNYSQCDYLSSPDSESQSEHFSEAFDSLALLVNDYCELIKLSVGNIQLAKDDLFELVDDVSVNRDTRRQNKRIREAHFNKLRQAEKSHVVSDISERLGANWDAYPAEETDADSLVAFIDKVDQIMLEKPAEPTYGVTIDEIRLYEAYKMTLLLELQARVSIVMLQIDYPSEARALFQPGNIEELPESMQRIAAADIHRGDKNSVILRHVLRSQAVDNDRHAKGRSTVEYVTDGSLSKESRTFFEGASRYAKAMGAAACPLNEFGICNKALENMQVTDHISSEASHKLKSRNKDEIFKLKSFANHIGSDPLKMNVKNILPEPEVIDDKLPKRKHRGVLGFVEQVVQAVESKNEIENPHLHFSKVCVQIAGQELAQIDTNDENSINGTLQAVLKTDMFKDYVNKHNKRGLEDFLRCAVKTILFSPAYQSEPSIEKILGVNHFYVNGKHTRLLRLSGSKLIGAKGGSIGRDTRILFAPIGEGRERTVNITAIKQKNGLTKTIYS